MDGRLGCSLLPRRGTIVKPNAILEILPQTPHTSSRETHPKLNRIALYGNFIEGTNVVT
jgi:hypothetical protein